MNPSFPPQPMVGLIQPYTGKVWRPSPGPAFLRCSHNFYAQLHPSSPQEATENRWGMLQGSGFGGVHLSLVKVGYKRLIDPLQEKSQPGK